MRRRSRVEPRLDEPVDGPSHRALKVGMLLALCAVLTACGSAGVASETPSSGGAARAGTTADVGAYVLDGVMHVGISAVALPTAEVIRFSTLEGGGAILGIRGGPVPNTSLIVDGKGHVLRTLLDVGWVVASDHSRILTGDGAHVAVLDPTGKEIATRADDRFPVALVGPVAYTADGMYSGSARATIAWNTNDGRTRSLPAGIGIVSADGSVAVSVTPDGVQGSVCHQVYALSATQVRSLRKVCGRQHGVAFVPEKASPDGRFLVGHDDAVNTASPVVAVVRTADGAFQLGSPEDDVEIHGWGATLGDGDAVVVSRSSPDGNRLESCTLQGRCTPLTSLVANDIGEPRYVLPDS